MRGKKALRTFGIVIGWLLLGWTSITFLVFVPVFNHMYCVNHSYISWRMPSRILQATGHGIAWPFYLEDLRLGPGYYAKKALKTSDKLDREVSGWTKGKMPSSEQLDEFDMRLMETIGAAKLVDCSFLNRCYPELGDRFAQDFLLGMERAHKGIQNREPLTTLNGVALMDRFVEWYNPKVDLINATF